MDKILEYKGYHTKILYDDESKTFFGKITDIDDLVTFESQSENEIVNEFQAAVDDYLEYCREVGKFPKKKYRQISVTQEIYSRLSEKAVAIGIPLNLAIEQAFNKYLEN